MEIIKANAVKFEYAYPDEAPKVVLHGVDLGIERGSFVAVLGHNGSGKSTLAKHFNAILLPTGGTVLVDGMDTADEEHVYDVRRTVGMVLQNPDNQMVSSIVEEHVAFGPENLGLPSEEIRERVDWALKSVGMYEHRGGTPFRLSGGQKQRLCIARAILKKPKVLILDDSTSAVDTATDAKIRQAFRQDLPGTTKLIVAQRVTSVMDADLILVMDDGAVAAQGTHEELMKTCEIYREVYESQQEGVSIGG